MKKAVMIFFICLAMMLAQDADANDRADVKGLAEANGFQVSEQIVTAIISAAQRFNIDPIELTTIGIIETGLGKYSSHNVNTNGTIDSGIFQINSVNHSKCNGFDLNSADGSALCAAKLLSQIKTRHIDYLGRYHSKTPSRKKIYLKKVAAVLLVYSNSKLTQVILADNR